MNWTVSTSDWWTDGFVGGRWCGAAGGRIVEAFRARQYLGRAFGIRESRRIDVREFAVAEWAGGGGFHKSAAGAFASGSGESGVLAGVEEEVTGDCGGEVDGGGNFVS